MLLAPTGLSVSAVVCFPFRTLWKTRSVSWRRPSRGTRGTNSMWTVTTKRRDILTWSCCFRRRNRGWWVVETKTRESETTEHCTQSDYTEFLPPGFRSMRPPVRSWKMQRGSEMRPKGISLPWSRPRHPCWGRSSRLMTNWSPPMHK